MEPRRLLTADAALLGFDALGDNLRVQYYAENPGDADLRLALYASPDGSAAGGMLHSVPLSREASEAVIAGHLLNLGQNELLLARLESTVDDVSESIVLSQMGLQGGVVQDAEGVIHVFGGAGSDIIGIYEFGVLGVSFNGAYYAYGLETVADVTLHNIGSDDLVSMNGAATTSEALDEGDAGDGTGGEAMENIAPQTLVAEGEGSGDGTGGAGSGGSGDGTGASGDGTGGSGDGTGGSGDGTGGSDDGTGGSGDGTGGSGDGTGGSGDGTGGSGDGTGGSGDGTGGSGDGTGGSGDGTGGSGDGTGGSGDGTGGSGDGTGGSGDGTGGEAPVLEDFSCFHHSSNLWIVQGTVSDDGPTSELIVSVGYWGEYVTTTVDESGAFSHAFYFEPGTYATVDASAVDGDGLESNWLGCYIDNDQD